MLERIYEMVAGAYHGARDGWNGSAPQQNTISDLQRGYGEKWAIYEGTLFQNAIDYNPYRSDPTVYRNIKLLWKHSEAIVDFYAGTIYQGVIPSAPPAEGVRLGGAIPIVAGVTGSNADVKNANLLRASVELFTAWNWQEQMSLRPMFASSLGDVLTEIVDDKQRRFPYPQIVWPGFVKEIELDYVGNVQRHVLEYRVTQKLEGGRSESFMFRKEVDKEAFRYFKDEKPYDANGEGAVVPNPYGFVPAIWDRHRKGAPGSVRGRGALDGTRQALLQLNSIFSHAFDFQRKAFFVPAMLATTGGAVANAEIDTTADEEEFDVVPVPDGSVLLQPRFDLGQTRELLADVREGILAEAPEAQFYEKLRSMATIATETARLLMGDVGNRKDLVASGMDQQTIKLVQMAIAIAGLRASDGTWNERQLGRNTRLTQRQMAFLPFGLDSYAAGDLDFSIERRELVPMSETERVMLVRQKEAIQTPWGFSEVGVKEDTAAKIINDRTAAQWRSINGGSYADLMNVSETE